MNQQPRPSAANSSATSSVSVNSLTLIGLLRIGHLLLNVQTHSPAGIMRGDWNLWDLQNASYGYLLFTTRQAKAIREEAGRRFIAPLPESRTAPN